MQIDLSSLGIFIRGGISIGLAYHDEYNAFGPAMNEAYRLESTKAESPRIILTSQTLYDGIKASESLQNPYDISLLESLIRQDKADGFYYLDYLRQYQELDYPEFDYYLWLNTIRDYLVQNLNSYHSDEKIYPKYRWMLEYWNDVLNSPGLSIPVEEETSADERKRIRENYSRLVVKPEYPYQ